MMRPLRFRLRLKIEVCNIYKEFEGLIHLIKELELDK